MRKYIYICIGGAAGAITRYFAESVSLIADISLFPYNTLLINLSGSFLLTYLLTIFFEAWEIPSEVRIGLAVGYIGAYTTFSTFCKEAVKLFLSGEWQISLIYIFISIIIGLCISFFGIFLARKTVKSILEKKHKNKSAHPKRDN